MKRSMIVLPFCFALVMLLSGPAWAEDLPHDPRIKTGELDNGVKWMWRKHDNPPGKLALWIHVDTGSLNEKEEQRGLAHFIEHMGFNGSENFPPGELIPYFESIGMKFGPDVNAHTGLDHTAYKLYLPDTTEAQVDKGLMVLSDYAFRMSFIPEEIDKERGVVLSELRAGMSAQQRIRDEFLEKVFAGTRLAKRLPIGVEDVLENAERPVFMDYYQTWYRPENVTLMVVGDAEPEPYLPLIEKWFGKYEAPVPARPQRGPEIQPFGQTRAVVLSDPEYSMGNFALYMVRPGRPPITTVELSRIEMIEQLGSWIMGRRFSERVKKGEAAYQTAYAATMNFFNDKQLVTAASVGEPNDWEKLAEELITEVNRAAEHGFTERELELAKTEFRASAERAVETESTRNARGFINDMNTAVNNEEPVISAKQGQEILERLLPEITLDEVTSTFRKNFKLGQVAYVLTMPEKDDVELPNPDDVLATARAAESRKTEAIQEEVRQTELLESAPTPGEVVEVTKAEDLGITSGWLSNGARFHHRYMDYKKDTVMVSINFAGGQIEETTENVGVTSVASLALQQPATSRVSSTDVEDIMTGKKIGVSGGGRDDMFVISVEGSPADLEVGLQLAHAIITDGKIEQSAFDKWKQTALQQQAMARLQPQYVGFETYMKLSSGDDPRRIILPTVEQIKSQSIERGQRWLDRIFREAPIEIAVVGDIEFEQVKPLLETYIGSLPERPRSAKVLDALRDLGRAAGPLAESVDLKTITPQAFAMYGFFGADMKDMRDYRALNVAANILDSRLIKQIREERGMVYSIGATNSPGAVYRDSGAFFSGAPCAPDRSEEVIAEIKAIFDSFAESGPTEEEMKAAQAQIANELDTQLKEPSFWFSQLRQLDLHGIELDNLRNIESEYAGFGADDVQQVFKKYYTPKRTFQVAVEPQAMESNAGVQPAPANAE